MPSPAASSWYSPTQRQTSSASCSRQVSGFDSKAPSRVILAAATPCLPLLQGHIRGIACTGQQSRLSTSLGLIQPHCIRFPVARGPYWGCGHIHVAAELNCSCDRSTNKNGLLRQFFSKSMPPHEVAPEQVRKAVDLLNDQPRKWLGYQTPRKALWKL